MKDKFPRAIFAGRAVQDTIRILTEEPDGFDAKVDYTDEPVFIGGSAPNAAIAFGMLGRKHYHKDSAWLYTPIGEADNLVNRDMSENGVILRDCSPASDFKLLRNYGFAAGKKRFIGRDATPERNRYSENLIGLPPLALERLSYDIKDADIVMIDTRCPLITTTVARAARDANVPVVLDAGAWKEYLPSLIALSDVVIASHELKPEGQKTTPQGIIEYLKSKGIARAAVTCGGHPTLLDDGHGLRTIAVPKVDVIDTFAAGDIMHGGFCWFYAHNKDMGYAIEGGNIVASESARFAGPREGVRRMEPFPDFEIA